MAATATHDVLFRERAQWAASGARCYFCGGPSFAWMTDDETWARVEPLLGQQQACFECFGAAWLALGHNNGDPFFVTESVRTPSETKA